jgi:PAS domain S-box-containing protein
MPEAADDGEVTKRAAGDAGAPAPGELADSAPLTLAQPQVGKRKRAAPEELIRDAVRQAGADVIGCDSGEDSWEHMPRARARGADCSDGSVSPACCGGLGEVESLDAFQELTATQQAIIRRLTAILDTKQDSVVITNPLRPRGPIVYVTSAWQDMCGYSATQAVGQNPRLTQGEHTDPETVLTMRRALTAEQPCRVRIINYRGYNADPFWNCLSVRQHPPTRARPPPAALAHVIAGCVRPLSRPPIYGWPC